MSNQRCATTGKAAQFCFHCSPLGWAKGILNAQAHVAKAKEYLPPAISVEGLLALRAATSHCYLCGEKLNWDDGPHLDHNHKTGEVRGYAHGSCNIIIGHLNTLRDTVGRGDRTQTINVLNMIVSNWIED
jgi:hypothetical protein